MRKQAGTCIFILFCFSQKWWHARLEIPLRGLLRLSVTSYRLLHVAVPRAHCFKVLNGIDGTQRGLFYKTFLCGAWASYSST